jgi:mono/diheme cytochrome c family protein
MRDRFRLSIFATSILSVIAGGAMAAESVPPVVPGYNRLKTIEKAGGDAAAGELLLAELNCTACHAPDGDVNRSRVAPKGAPELSNLGARVTPQWLRAYLTDPHSKKPGATMPDIFHASEQQSRYGAVDFLVHFLLSQGGPIAPSTVEGNTLLVDQGRELFHTVGCVACHAPQEKPKSATPGATADTGATPTGRAKADTPDVPSVPLGDLASKTTVDRLTVFLFDPLKVRPHGRMPAQGLNAGEARAISVYLLRDQLNNPQVASAPPARSQGLRYAYYKPEKPVRDAKLETFETLKPAAEGKLDKVGINIPNRAGDEFAVKLTGVIAIPRDGKYTFRITSDDGSRLYLDGQQLIDHDGIHGGDEKSASVDLKTGDHPLVITFFEAAGGEELKLAWEGPGIDRQDVPASALFSVGGRPMVPLGSVEKFTPEPQKVAMGQRMFSLLGCASCHTLPDAKPERAAKALVELNSDAPDGCLSDHVRKGLPQYHLSAEQRGSIRSALKNVAQLNMPLDPVAQVARGMAAMNCFACHLRDGAGGVAPQRQDFFVMTAVFDMGDEGRLPPLLTGAGAKLKPAALEQIVTAGNLHVRRHHMATRMPQFPKERVAGLLDAITNVDLPGGDDKGPAFTEGAARDGRLLVGTKGMGCVNCHGAAGAKSLGMPSVDLMPQYERLRWPWFKKLMLDPAKVNPGTRMPGFWTDGNIIYKDVAGGTVDGQIAALWAYLSLGKSMPPPAGVRPEGAGMELIAIEEPIIHRTFMAEIGPRAIAVGFPSNLNVAFDANTVRLAKAWRGRFFDAKGMWEGRGGSANGPLGTDVLNLPPGPAIAVLGSPSAPWPRPKDRNDRDVGGKFLGYRVDKLGQPIFRYRVGEVEVEEQPLPLLRENGVAMVRRFSLAAKGKAPADVYCLLAAGAKVEAGSGSEEWKVDDKVRVRLNGSDLGSPAVREKDGKKQLLLPVKFDSQGKATFELEIAW